MKPRGLAASITAAVAGLGVIATTVFAGVVINEQETITRDNQPSSRTRTIMIDGNRQKIVTERSEMVTDLDKGVMILINPARKTYAQMPFPPKNASGAREMKSIDFKKTGASRTIYGYKCEEYTATSHVMGAESKIAECFSKDAPGAADFTAFQNTMNAKLKAAGDTGMERNIPTGVPLASESTTSMAGLKIPGMAPDQAEKFAQMMANRPPITTKAEVTKITVKSIPASEFAPPAGFTQQAIPSHPTMAPSQPHAHSLPE